MSHPLFIPDTIVYCTSVPMYVCVQYTDVRGLLCLCLHARTHTCVWKVKDQIEIISMVVNAVAKAIRWGILYCTVFIYIMYNIYRERTIIQHRVYKFYYSLPTIGISISLYSYTYNI